MMIYTFVPYSIEGNLVKAYNDCMKLLGEEDLALFLDYDVIFTRRDWYLLFDKATKKYEEVGIFTCYTNRIKTPFQLVPDVDNENHDLRYHIKFGQKLYIKNKESVTIMKKGDRLGGFAMLIRKNIWSLVKPNREGIEFIDTEIGKKCHRFNIKIARLDSLYAYHWRRGLNEGPPSQNGE